MMKLSEEEVLEFFNKNPTNISNIILFAKNVFEKRCKLSKKLFSSAYLIQIVRQTCSILKMPVNFKARIQFKLYDVIAEYRILGGQRTKPAEIKSPVKIRKLIATLWFRQNSFAKRPQPFSLEKLIRRRMIALITLFCFVSGRRWVDITRLRWDFVKFLKLPQGNFIRFPINISKGNAIGKRNESLILAQDDSHLCPVKLLIRFWILSGRPKVGFLFSCRHKNRKLVKRFFTSGRAYCCNGHKRGSQKVECLGSIDPIVSQGIMSRAAKKLGFKTPPTRHTFRRLLCLMAAKLGIPKDRLCEQFGWTTTSEMPSHYLMDSFGTSTDSIAFKLASIVQSDSSFSFMKDVPVEK